MADKRKITLKINNKNYTLLHDETDDYMHRIAHFLNSKIGATSKSGLQLGENTSLVMAAVVVTDELFKAQKNFNTLKNEIKRMMDEYDQLKTEKREADAKIAELQKQNSELSQKLLIARFENNGTK